MEVLAALSGSVWRSLWSSICYRRRRASACELNVPVNDATPSIPRISSSQARLVDTAAVRRLLYEVPEAERIAAQLARPFFTRRWQQSAKRSFWIESDGTSVLCLTLTGLEVDEIVAVWVCFDTYYRQAGLKLSARMLSEVIETELGVSVSLEI